MILEADEQIIKQYEAICKIYAERGLAAYHVQLRPLRKELEKFAQHVWVQDALKFNREDLTLSVEQGKTLLRHILHRMKEIEHRLSRDFQQEVQREILDLLIITNEGITREDLVDRYEIPHMAEFSNLLNIVKAVFLKGEMFRNFFYTRDLSKFKKGLEQERTDQMKVAKRFLQNRQKARSDYETKREALIKTYQEWVELNVPSTTSLPAAYLDCDLVSLNKNIVKVWEIGRIPLQRFLT